MSSAEASVLQSGTSIPGAISKSDWLTYKRDEYYHLHCWVITEPFHGSTLKLQPLNVTGSVSGTLIFKNSRGECINECNIATHAGQQVVLDLDAFLAGGETEGGLKHAHLELITNAPCNAQVQLSTSVRSVLIPPLHNLSDRCPRAVPVSLSPHHNHILALVNPFDRQSTVRVRLFVDTRTPEEVCIVPANGTLLISPEVLFYTVMDDLGLRGVQESAPPPSTRGIIGENTSKQGYLRLSTRHDRPLGFQLIEELTFGGDEKVLGVVS